MPKEFEDVVLRNALNAIAGTRVGRLCRLIAVAIHNKDGRLLERRHKECRGMRIVVADLRDVR